MRLLLLLLLAACVPEPAQVPDAAADAGEAPLDAAPLDALPLDAAPADSDSVK